MDLKRAKLDQQFDAGRGTAGKTNIFNGVSIYVNGWTGVVLGTPLSATGRNLFQTRRRRS